MLSVARFPFRGWFVASVVFLGTGAVGVAADGAVPTANEHDGKKTIARWLDRTEQYANRLGEKEFCDVLPVISGPMTAADDWKRVEGLANRIKDPDQRVQARINFCLALALSGRFDAAIRAAESVPAERNTDSSGHDVRGNRNGVFLCVFRIQSSNYDFAGAKETIKLIDDPMAVSRAYNRLAESQAKAGLYADAEESLRKFVATNEDDKKAKEDTRQLVACYKAKGQKDPPRKQQGTYLEGLRLASTIFGDMGIKLHNLAEAEVVEKMADAVKGPVNKAGVWREIAWNYYGMRDADKKNLERCRRAIDKSVQYAEKVPEGLGNSYLRTVAFTSAADLYLELGELGLAKQMVKKADAVNLAADMLGGLNSFTTTPMLIAILVRVGDVDGATAVAEKLQKVADKDTKEMFPTNPDAAWSSWATVCTLEGKTACVERQLERVSNARTKAVLCAGVATGLLELQQHPVGKKPPSP
jgi:tetratricopeptide (TPR) repeat protein